MRGGQVATPSKTNMNTPAAPEKIKKGPTTPFRVPYGKSPTTNVLGAPEKSSNSMPMVHSMPGKNLGNEFAAANPESSSGVARRKRSGTKKRRRSRSKKFFFF